MSSTLAATVFSNWSNPLAIQMSAHVAVDPTMKLPPFDAWIFSNFAKYRGRVSSANVFLSWAFLVSSGSRKRNWIHPARQDFRFAQSKYCKNLRIVVWPYLLVDRCMRQPAPHISQLRIRRSRLLWSGEQEIAWWSQFVRLSYHQLAGLGADPMVNLQNSQITAYGKHNFPACNLLGFNPANSSCLIRTSSNFWLTSANRSRMGSPRPGASKYVSLYVIFVFNIAKSNKYYKYCGSAKIWWRMTDNWRGITAFIQKNSSELPVSLH